MSNTDNIVPLVARILLALLFVVSGLGKLGNVEGFAAYMASGGIPAALAWPAILFEIFVGLALIVGFQTRAAALALAAFSVVAAFLYHFQPADQMQMAMFLKNISIAGGFILLAVVGAGAYSVDAKLAPAQ